MLTENMQKNLNQQNPYLVQKIVSASPEELIAYIYEAAIKACNQEDQRRALEAIQELINALNFDAKEISPKFYYIYQHVIHLVNTKKYVEARGMLNDLRSTWVQAMKLQC